MEAASNSTMSFDIHIKLTESEARALSVLPSYGTEVFIRVFYEHLGKTYMQPHEKGLISLLKTIPEQIDPHLERIDKTRKVFQDNNPNKTPSMG